MNARELRSQPGSITPRRETEVPSETWPALVARQHGWDCVSLGFAGECHLDPVAARTIRDLPARLISLCLGINIYGGETFSGRTLPGQIEAFISTVREGHPKTPIVVITPREFTRRTRLFPESAM